VRPDFDWDKDCRLGRNNASAPFNYFEESSLRMTRGGTIAFAILVFAILVCLWKRINKRAQLAVSSRSEGSGCDAPRQEMIPPKTSATPIIISAIPRATW
jgi:hypothetical protein